MEKIGLYCKDAGKKKQIQELASLLKIKVYDITPQDLSKSVGNLSGISKTQCKKVSVPIFYNMPEVLLFSGIADKRLDTFLASYKMKNIEPISLKAVVTMYNCSWSLFDLIEELKKEHANFNE